jgi:hypothetical protein
MGIEEKVRAPAAAAGANGAKKSTKNLKDNHSGDAAREYDLNRAIQERNDIRALLLENFESVEIHLLKQPAGADALRQYAELPEHEVDAEFVAGIEKLLVSIYLQTRDPVVFSAARLSGPAAFGALTQIVAALNEQGNISVPSVYRAMESDVIARVYAEALKTFQFICEKLRRDLPLGAAALAARTTAAEKKMREMFEGELSECTLKDELEKRGAELSAAAAKARADLSRENAAAQLTRMKSVLSEQATTFKVQFEKWCEKNMPCDAESRALERRFEEQKRSALSAAALALEEISEVCATQEYKLALLEFEETAREYLSLKCIQNENTLKDMALKKLRQELIQQQETLIEQNRKLEKFLKEEKTNTVAMEKELERLKAEKEQQEKKNAETQKRLQEQMKELETLRKKKSRCNIL